MRWAPSRAAILEFDEVLYDSFLEACCASYSRICRLQLQPRTFICQYQVVLLGLRRKVNRLSTREESAGLRHLVAVLTVCTDAKSDGSNSDDKSTHDRSVGLPVAWLCVPTTSGGPNFLGVTAQGKSSELTVKIYIIQTYDIFPPPPILSATQLSELRRRKACGAEAVLVGGNEAELAVN